MNCNLPNTLSLSLSSCNSRFGAWSTLRPLSKIWGNLVITMKRLPSYLHNPLTGELSQLNHGYMFQKVPIQNVQVFSRCISLTEQMVEIHTNLKNLEGYLYQARIRTTTKYSGRMRMHVIAKRKMLDANA